MWVEINYSAAVYFDWVTLVQSAIMQNFHKGRVPICCVVAYM